MYYGNIKNNDIANGVGIRVSLFVSGCRNKCKNCFNQETWSFTYGNLFDSKVEERIIEFLKPNYINGLSILGGEPFEEENQKDLLPFIKKVRSIYPEKTIWIYTGYTLETDLLNENGKKHTEYTLEILRNIDILVDGRFVEELKNLSLKFRGSENQRIILIKETLEAGMTILSELNTFNNFKPQL